MEEEQKTSPDFITKYTFSTITGNATVVWIVCLVISGLVPENTIKCYYWRWIAFVRT